MARTTTFPTLYNETLKIDLSRLMKWGYFKEGNIKRGLLTWTVGEQIRGEITITSNWLNAQPFLLVDYKYRDEPREYKIYLTSVPSNLGNGEVYYFKCPTTNKRCRKLYSIGGWFLHREAFKGAYYEKQTYSKKGREADRFFTGYNLASKANEEINSKHFKKFYKGKPTKRYKKLLTKIRHCQRYTEVDFARMVYN